MVPFTWKRGALLGKGSYGHVFLGSSSTGQPLAIKSSKYAHSFTLQKEKIILEQFLDCPEVLNCFGYDFTFAKDGTCVYDLVLEYASGGTLSDLIKEHGGRIPEQDVSMYTRMLLRGLYSIHNKGYVHCDFKPDNILVFPFENGVKLKIADFGLSKVPEEEEENWKYRFRGTPIYMSPESVAEGRIDSAVDIWSLGCIVFEMLTGKRAWDLNMNRLFYTLVFEKKSPEIPYGICEEGRNFLHKCFQVNPDKRWTAAALLNHPFVQEKPKPVQLSDGLRSWLEAGDLAEEYWNRFDQRKPKRLTRDDHKRKKKCLVRLNMHNVGIAA